jgi:hypothetical protein
LFTNETSNKINILTDKPVPVVMNRHFPFSRFNTVQIC